MKRIAMVVTNPCTHDSRVIKEAESLATAGYEVTVFCLWRKDLPKEEHKAGVRYVRIPLANSRITKHSLRLWIGIACFPLLACLHMASRCLHHMHRKLSRIKMQLRSIVVNNLRYRVTYHTFINALLQYRPDIIHAHDLTTLPTGVKAARKLDAKLVFDSHELEEHRDPPLPRLQRYRIRKLLDKYQPKADAMIVVSEGIAEYTRQHHPSHPPLHVIYNAPSHNKGSQPCASLREALAIPPDSKLAIYIGGVGLNRGVDLIVRALARDPSLHLAILGPRHPYFDKRLAAVIDETGTAARVHFPPIVNNDDVIHTASIADVGIHVPRNTCLNHYYSMPNKLFEMTFARIPIVGAADAYDISRFITANGLGITVNQHDPQAMLQGIYDAIAMKESLRKDERKYTMLKAHFSWEAQEQKLLSLYAGLYKEA